MVLLLPPGMLQQGLTALQQNLHTRHSHPAGAVVMGLALLLLALATLRSVFGVIRFVFAYFLRPGRNLKAYGEWAVVTGATDGIGKAYCEQLAQKGERRWRAAGGQLAVLLSLHLCAPLCVNLECSASPHSIPSLYMPQASTWCLFLAPNPSSRQWPLSWRAPTACRRAPAPPT